MQKVKLCLGNHRSAGRGLSPGRPAESELRVQFTPRNRRKQFRTAA
jgi:hypothetical protein